MSSKHPTNGASEPKTKRQWVHWWFLAGALTGGLLASLFIGTLSLYPRSNLALGASEDQRQKVRLTGLWTLNKDLSDDPAKVMEAMQAERHARLAEAVGCRLGASAGMGPECTAAAAEWAGAVEEWTPSRCGRK